jgi:hypothetical protein
MPRQSAGFQARDLHASSVSDNPRVGAVFRPESLRCIVKGNRLLVFTCGFFAMRADVRPNRFSARGNPSVKRHFLPFLSSLQFKQKLFIYLFFNDTCLHISCFC